MVSVQSVINEAQGMLSKGEKEARCQYVHLREINRVKGSHSGPQGPQPQPPPISTFTDLTYIHINTTVNYVTDIVGNDYNAKFVVLERKKTGFWFVKNSDFCSILVGT